MEGDLCTTRNLHEIPLENGGLLFIVESFYHYYI